MELSGGPAGGCVAEGATAGCGRSAGNDLAVYPRSVRWRRAELGDVPTLVRMNADLLEDEANPHRLSIEALEARMRGWLASEYGAVHFESDAAPVAYALYRTEEDSFHGVAKEWADQCVASARRSATRRASSSPTASSATAPAGSS